MTRPSECSIYLHYPCFDGLVSAAIAWDFLEGSQGWSPGTVCPVNYGSDQRAKWLTTALPPQSVVVDFLYHPDAFFWADHHATTFLNEEARLAYERHENDRSLLYDPKVTSCAKLLWEHLAAASSDPGRYEEMAYWADRTDSAKYDSVDEALFGAQPGLQIARSLSASRDDSYCEFLLRHMHTDTLAQIAALPEVAARERDVWKLTQNGLDFIRKNKRMAMRTGGIVVLEVDEIPDMIVNRYSPYEFYPDARYSVALSRSSKDASILAMRNPWRDFESVDLGKIFEKLGETFDGVKGGGHQRVAAVVISANSQYEPEVVLSEIVDQIRRKDRELAPGAKAIAS